MEKGCGKEFLRIAARHAEEAAYMQTIASAQNPDSLSSVQRLMAHAVAQEKASRAMVLAWKPRSNLEAQSKLLYIVRYLIVMRTSLDDREMDAIMSSISHLQGIRSRLTTSSSYENQISLKS